MSGYLLLYLQVGDDSQCDGGHVKAVGDEIQNIPSIAHVVEQTELPELLDLAPDQADHPSEHHELDQGRWCTALGDRFAAGIYAENVESVRLYPLTGQCEEY